MTSHLLSNFLDGPHWWDRYRDPNKPMNPFRAALILVLILLFGSMFVFAALLVTVGAWLFGIWQLVKLLT